MISRSAEETGVPPCVRRLTASQAIAPQKNGLCPAGISEIRKCSNKVNCKPLVLTDERETTEKRFCFHPGFAKWRASLSARGHYAGPSTTIMSSIPEPNRNSTPKSFVVQYHVRGRRKRQLLTTRCQTVQNIIDMGQQSFPAFTDRNPWICIDSKHATAFVGVDPEHRALRMRQRRPI